jgi:hypothetical protein
MALQITKNYIPNLPQTPYDGGIGAYKGVIAHATDTDNIHGGNDTKEGERAYEVDTWGSAFVHFFVDSTGILQTADTNYICWGAGHTGNHAGYVQVELCETDDATLFAKSYDLYTSLLAWLLFDKRLGVVDAKTLWSHAEISNTYHETDHQDPIAYLASHGKTWQNVVSDVTLKYNNLAFENAITNSKLISTPDYWRTNCNVGLKVNGAYANRVILNFVAMYKLCNNFGECIDYLVANNFVSNGNYWKTNAILGQFVDGGYMGILLSKIGNKL